jgi:hypothetical protein
MNWRGAFLAQAKSDNEMRKLLNRAKVPYSHQLHYLQMTAEKLAKGILTPHNAPHPPPFSHAAVVALLRALKVRPDIRRHLGYSSVRAFSAFIDALLPFADRIQRLAPNFAGESQPNPEYPWRPTANHPVVVPAEFDFPELKPDNPKIVQLVNLLDRLLTLPV